MTKSLYAGSWNTSQNMPHRQKLDEYLKESRVKILGGKEQDWILISIGDDKEVSRDLEFFAKNYESFRKKGGK